MSKENPFEGLPQTRDKVIEDHLGFVITIARDMAKNCQHREDDYVSEAMFTLTKKIDWLCRHPEYIEKIDYPMQYIKSSVFRSIQKMDRGHVNVESLTVDVGHQPCEYELSDLLSDALSMCETDDERQVVHLRHHGYTDREVAKEMGQDSHAASQRARQNVRDRYYEALSC